MEGVLIAMTGHSHSSNLNADGSINYNAGNWFPFDDQTISGDEQGRKEMPQFYVFEMKGDKPMPSDPGKSDSPSGMIQTMLILRGNWYPNGKTEGLGNDVVKKIATTVYQLSKMRLVALLVYNVIPSIRYTLR